MRGRLGRLEERRAEAERLGAEIKQLIEEFERDRDSDDPVVAAYARRVLDDVSRILGESQER